MADQKPNHVFLSYSDENEATKKRAIMEALETLKRAQKQQDREKVLWEGTELLYLSCWDGCWSTCCGGCRWKSS